MAGFAKTRRRSLMRLGVVIFALCNSAGCEQSNANGVHGYVEGEFVYVAAPLAGTLQSLYVERGAAVQVGDPLFALDTMPEKVARDEAERRLDQARASLEDARQGKRPSEIEAIEAQLQQARAALALSEKQLSRQESLKSSSAAAGQDIDQARAIRDQDRARVAQLTADLKTAQLGARDAQVEAAEAEVRAREESLTHAEWNLAQKSQAATQPGIVFDTLYRPGEWVAAGRPVVALLPPQNIKVRAFVPELEIGRIQLGDRARVAVDGVPGPFLGKVSFISPRAEFTPPVIYSRESRSKLVFMVELAFPADTAEKLHPGQPVDVQFGPQP